jgi:hypothetical protein
MWSCKWMPTFQGNILPLCSEMKGVRSGICSVRRAGYTGRSHETQEEEIE